MNVMLRERELREQAEAASEEIQRLTEELDRLKGELDRVREEFRYVEDEEAKAAIADVEDRIRACQERIREVEALRERLLQEIEELRRKSEREVKKARRQLPEAVQRFYRSRRELLEALTGSVEGLQDRLKPVLEAVEAYYKAGERLTQVAYQAREYGGGGWVFSASELSRPARRLWERTIAQEKVPEELHVEEETLELLRWWFELLERIPQLKRDFPPCVMTPRIERKLKEEAEKARRELEERLRRRREGLLVGHSRSQGEAL